MIIRRDKLGRIAKGNPSGQKPIYEISLALLDEADRMTPYGESKLKYVADRVGCERATVGYRAKKLRFRWTYGPRERCLYTTTRVERRYVYGIGCVICGEKRVVDAAHLVPRKGGGWGMISNIIPMCPTHHRCYDSGLLSDSENDKLVDFLYQKFPGLSKALHAD